MDIPVMLTLRHIWGKKDFFHKVVYIRACTDFCANDGAAPGVT